MSKRIDVAVKEFINNHSFIENEQIGVEYKGERVIPVECIKEMAKYYFSNKAECEDTKLNVNDVFFDDANIPTELDETISYMVGDYYMHRFKAEYYQLKIRLDKLEDMLNKWAKGKLKFTPTCPRSTYDLQIRAMKDYLAILEARAKMENVDL